MFVAIQPSWLTNPMNVMSPFHPLGVDKWVVSYNQIASAVTISGGAVWWTLTRWRQVWCVCSVKTVWSIPERFRGELLTMRAVQIYLSFTSSFIQSWHVVVSYNTWITVVHASCPPVIPATWNSLLEHLQTSHPTLNSFKCSLKTNLYTHKWYMERIKDYSAPLWEAYLWSAQVLITQCCYTANTNTNLSLPRKHSPDGTTTDW